MVKRDPPRRVVRQMLSSYIKFAAVVAEFYRQLDEKDALVAAVVSRLGELAVKEALRGND